MSTAEDYRGQEYRGQAYDPRQERPITGLFADLFRETATLIRAEVELAKTELTAKAGEAAGGAAFVAAGGLVAFLGAIFLLAAATLALAQTMPGWLAALIVGGVVTAIGVVLLLMGRNRLKPRNLQPERTMETLREDKRWARSQLSR